MEKLIDRFRRRWGVQNIWDIALIFASFSLAGMTAAMVGRPIINHCLYIMGERSLWARIPLYFVFDVPLYQFFLLFWGALLGQFKFFWEREKMIGRWLAKRFQKLFWFKDVKQEIN